MTKMATMLINGKNPLKIFSGPKGPLALGLGMQHWGHVSMKFEKDDDLQLTLTFLVEGPMALGLGMQHMGHGPIKFEKIITFG